MSGADINWGAERELKVEMNRRGFLSWAGSAASALVVGPHVELPVRTSVAVPAGPAAAVLQSAEWRQLVSHELAAGDVLTWNGTAPSNERVICLFAFDAMLSHDAGHERFAPEEAVGGGL